LVHRGHYQQVAAVEAGWVDQLDQHRHAASLAGLAAARRTASASTMHQSCPWVGLVWVEIFQFLVGWVGSTTAKVLKI